MYSVCFCIIWIISRCRHTHTGRPWLMTIHSVTIQHYDGIEPKDLQSMHKLRAIAAPQFWCLTVHLHLSLQGCFNYPHPHIPPPSQPSIWPTSVQSCYGPGRLQNAPYPSRLGRPWSAPCPTRMCRMSHLPSLFFTNYWQAHSAYARHGLFIKASLHHSPCGLHSLHCFESCLVHIMQFREEDFWTTAGMEPAL